ncbi:hypothetical protein BDQ94DRAFT_137710 [Aspergillus welwitschiae]|uniref:Uncharacterized protein n=1 Tax=Aspergillus welwitschiae TaxID=1341132 RepID=A0A3F3QDC7_9EURO|nr:hypothetical protein BDQ94DRAFT_137710 [Aspergillus welwitschiae]RDH37213.1 hypothetical protein BDQ94DRAFT_137710 [Aspergillus welwitschiae]
MQYNKYRTRKVRRADQKGTVYRNSNCPWPLSLDLGRCFLSGSVVLLHFVSCFITNPIFVFLNYTGR